ncbi:hypothetical protein [Streptomyces sp. NPDC059168]|uniref:hypothetical protein n=1 Tax=Streptomyces sp. NPDC059168 TaxID=3346753 RepID=UPI0036BC2605
MDGVFEKMSGLLGARFMLGLLMPLLAWCGGVGALVATAHGWTATLRWWDALSVSKQVLLAVAAAVGVVVLATMLGTVVIPLTRMLEGYWGQLGNPFAALGVRLQKRRLERLESQTTDFTDYRIYLGFPDTDLLPTRLGNILRAAETYSGDSDRWAVDAVFWWPRLYVLLSDASRQAVDDTRDALDQLVVMTWLLAAFGLVAAGFGVGGMSTVVWLPCSVGGLAASRVTYLAATSAAAGFGEQVRSSFDLYRLELLTHLGWQTPAQWPDERALWQALQQQLYRRGASQSDLLTQPRTSQERQSWFNVTHDLAKQMFRGRRASDIRTGDHGH